MLWGKQSFGQLVHVDSFLHELWGSPGAPGSVVTRHWVCEQWFPVVARCASCRDVGAASSAEPGRKRAGEEAMPSVTVQRVVVGSVHCM